VETEATRAKRPLLKAASIIPIDHNYSEWRSETGREFQKSLLCESTTMTFQVTTQM